MLKIGTFADWFGVGLIEGIKQSQRCGAQGVQVYAWNELDPAKVTAADIANVNKTAHDHSQQIVALCAELGGHGLEIAKDNDKKIEYLKRTVDMAIDLNCGILTTHLGIIPEDEQSDKYKTLQQACNVIASYAEQKNVKIAIETGPEPVERLCKFIDSCQGSMGVNYDPANLVMVTDVDEVKGVYTAGKRIAHTHAKDGIMHKFAGCEKIYGIFADGGIEALNTLSDYFSETKLGEGSVHWKEYIKALKDIAYDGFLTIEREADKDNSADIADAVKFLKSII